MRTYRSLSAAVAPIALAALIATAGCNKTPPAPAAEPTKAAEAPKAAEAKPAGPAEAAAVPPAAAPSPTAAPAAVMTDPCPAEGEDPAACPKKPEKIDDQIKVAHILIGWAGSLPGKTVTRTKDEAKKLAIDVAHQARKQGADFIPLMWQHTQDPGPGVYEATPEMRKRFVPEFGAMATSLGLGQVDIVESRFGFHVMKRLAFDFVAPEKPLEVIVTDACPGEGEDPAACPSKQDPAPKEVEVTHILVAYEGAMRAAPEVKRTKEEAKKLSIELAHKGRKKGADFGKIKDEAKSDDPGPGTYPVSADAPMVPPFKAMALRLGAGQVDVVETDFGYHVMKRTK
jgi:hypothetical protein